MGSKKNERTYARKATFKKNEQGKYVPVNSRAKAWLKDKKVAEKKDLKAIVRKSKGRVQVYVWTNAGLRKSVA